MSGLGTKLRLAREEKGLSIKQIQQAINIEDVYLHALEEEELSILPDKEAAILYARSYADFLEIDSNKLTSDLHKIWTDSNTAKNFLKESFSSTNNTHQGLYNKKMLSVIAIVVIIVAAIGISSILTAPDIASNGENLAGKPNANSLATNDAKQNADPEPEPELEPEPTPTPEPGSEITGVTVEVSASRDDCWLEVRVDGELAVYRLVKKGEAPLIFEGNEEISILIGNAAAVDISYNGEPLGILGEEEQVIKKIFTPANLE